jgi:diaminopropionate ammonia-lyase
MADTGPADWVHHERDRGWSCPPVAGGGRAFHASLTGYRPTPLADLPGVAAELGVGRVLAKDETSRLGLPAFKALGASWAIDRLLATRPAPGDAPVTFVTATDGNHGRAVARFARALGHRARVVVPDGVSAAAIAAIEAEGAPVDRIGGSYDDAVAAAIRIAGETGGELVQDMAWPGYQQVPAWIVEGYATLFGELADQLGGEQPDLVVVPAGVGSLAQAAVLAARSRPDPGRTSVVTVEPVTAACVLASLRAGRPVSVPTGSTTMAGLNCGTPSALAWPVLAAGLDGAVAVTDAEAAAAADALRVGGIDAGPCGWAALAGARSILAGVGSAARRAALGIGEDATCVLVVTEGAAANPGQAIEPGRPG